MKKQLLMGTLAAAIVAGVTAPAMADDGLAASAGVASAYLWRGIDLGDGAAAVSGDIHYSMAGAYGGLWASSGDSALGSEYDYYVGYGLEAGGVGIDLSVWNYNYSDGCTATQAAAAAPAVCDFNDGTTGDLSEVILALSLAGATFKYYDNVAGGSGYEYYTLSYGMNGFTGLVGYADPEEAAAAKDADYMHLDLSYAYNENLSFTVSKVMDEADNGSSDEDAVFVVSYALPIK